MGLHAHNNRLSFACALEGAGHTGKEHRGVCYSDVRYITVGKWSGFMTADVSEILKVLHSGNRIRGEQMSKALGSWNWISGASPHTDDIVPQEISEMVV